MGRNRRSSGRRRRSRARDGGCVPPEGRPDRRLGQPDAGKLRCAARTAASTSSARSSIDCGMVRPRALAVFRLITSSNLVGCSTGRSPGLAPLRILATQTAARNLSTRMRHGVREFTVAGSAHSSRRTGSVNVNVEPAPSWLFTRLRAKGPDVVVQEEDRPGGRPHAVRPNNQRERYLACASCSAA